MKKIVLAIHGGAGNTSIDLCGNSDHLPQVAHMKAILEQGYQTFLKGFSALDIVEQMIILLEDFSGFNAGRGAVLTSAGTVELDAAIMDGRTRDAGAVACVKTVKNPVSAARKLMQIKHHVLLVGEDADKFAQEQGLAIKTPEYFITERRRDELAQIQKNKKKSLDQHFGTVGAVALDSHGNLAAATSTGGKANQMPGRVGDSPIIGAGTWADNICAISATGDGEAFMRCAFSHNVTALMQYKNMNINSACEHSLQAIAQLGSHGGCIALDKDGNLSVLYNTQYMYRGYVDNEGVITGAV